MAGRGRPRCAVKRGRAKKEVQPTEGQHTVETSLPSPNQMLAQDGDTVTQPVQANGPYANATDYNSALEQMTAAVTNLGIHLSNEDLLAFHHVDRKVYKKLAINLGMDPAKSMQVVAAWMWLEVVGFRDLVVHISELHNIQIYSIAAETASWLECLLHEHSPDEVNILHFNWLDFMQVVVGAEISIRQLMNDRSIAISGIDNSIQTPCSSIFTDIYALAMEDPLDYNSETSGTSETRDSVREPIVIPPPPRSPLVSAKERSLFITFSKSYRVYEWELRGLFTTMYGDCVEGISMSPATPYRSSMFGQVILRDAETMHMVLAGAHQVRFTVNDKHVWAQKFDPSRKTPMATTYSRYVRSPLIPHDH